MFLLPGQYNIYLDRDRIGDSVFQGASRSLIYNFHDIYFMILHESKLEILEDLDDYKINESSLFSEL